MFVRIEAGAITEFHGVYKRNMHIICDNGLVFAETLHSGNKEELVIVDFDGGD